MNDFLKMQKRFSDACFQSNKMTDEERLEKHKTFCLALHDEVSQMANSIHFKDHRQVLTPTDRQKILYESVDVLRYAFAVLNLWDFQGKDLEDAFMSRDAQLWDKKNRPLSRWSGQPVVIVDVDDVIARFREGFFDWLNKKFDLNVSTEIPEYYYSGPVGRLTGEEAFSLFIEADGFRNLRENTSIIKSLNTLQAKGYWIQLLTARPADNLKCMYDTYVWLNSVGVPYDNVDFSFEKYRWLSDKEFYKKGKVVCAIDDSPKHASEYVSQGVQTLVPKRSYNKEVWDKHNILTFDWEKEGIDDIVTSITPGHFFDTQSND